MTKPDMSPAAITRRWKQVDELRELCLVLAGPRLKRPWGVPPAQDLAPLWRRIGDAPVADQRSALQKRPITDPRYRKGRTPINDRRYRKGRSPINDRRYRKGLSLQNRCSVSSKKPKSIPGKTIKTSFHRKMKTETAY